MAAYLLPLGLHLNLEKEGQPNPGGNAEWQTKRRGKPEGGWCSVEICCSVSIGFHLALLRRGLELPSSRERVSNQDAKNVAGRNRLGGSYL